MLTANPIELFVKGKQAIDSAEQIFLQKKFSNHIVSNLVFEGVENVLAYLFMKRNLFFTSHCLKGFILDLLDEKTIPLEMRKRLKEFDKVSSHHSEFIDYSDEEVVVQLKLGKEIIELLEAQ